MSDHDVRNRQSTPEEQDEVGCQLVPVVNVKRQRLQQEIQTKSSFLHNEENDVHFFYIDLMKRQ